MIDDTKATTLRLWRTDALHELRETMHKSKPKSGAPRIGPGLSRCLSIPPIRGWENRVLRDCQKFERILLQLVRTCDTAYPHGAWLAHPAPAVPLAIPLSDRSAGDQR